MESGHIVRLVSGNVNTSQGSVYLILPAVNSSLGLRACSVLSAMNGSLRRILCLKHKYLSSLYAKGKNQDSHLPLSFLKCLRNISLYQELWDKIQGKG